MSEERPKASRRFPLWETVSILLAIAALWPAYILRWPQPVWRWLSYAMLGVMAVVFVRRMVAFRRLAREAEEKRRREGEQDEGGQGRARLPWEPPAGDDA